LGYGPIGTGFVAVNYYRSQGLKKWRNIVVRLKIEAGWTADASSYGSMPNNKVEVKVCSVHAGKNTCVYTRMLSGLVADHWYKLRLGRMRRSCLMTSSPSAPGRPVSPRGAR